jgi:hypothetical protein
VAPLEGVDAVLARVASRLPPHLRRQVLAPSCRPANLSNDDKAFFLQPFEALPWQPSDAIATSQLFARVVRGAAQARRGVADRAWKKRGGGAPTSLARALALSATF